MWWEEVEHILTKLLGDASFQLPSGGAGSQDLGWSAPAFLLADSLEKDRHHSSLTRTSEGRPTRFQAPVRGINGQGERAQAGVCEPGT